MKESLAPPTDYERWYAEHHQALLSFVATRVGRSQAEDVCQEIWTRVWKHHERFLGGNVRAWLFTVTRNFLIERSRSRQVKQNRRTVSMYAVQDEEKGPMPIAEPMQFDEFDDDVLERLRHCLGELDAGKRAIVTGWLSGAGYESFAAGLGLTTEQAQRRFHTAKESLRKCLGAAP